MSKIEPFHKELLALLKMEFPAETLLKLTQMSNALTAVVYSIDFKNKSLMVKIGYDVREILMGKGEREKKALNIANSILGNTISPKLVRYYKNYDKFPGYVTFIEKLPGKVLDAQEFNKVALSDNNIKHIVALLKRLHKHKSGKFDELTPSSASTVYEYFLGKYDHICKSLNDAGISDQLSKNSQLLPRVFNYFKDYKNNSFIHGDINFKNIMMAHGEVSALIDWDRSLIGPIGFEFAQISPLTEKYGVSQWHSKLRDSYFNSYEGDGDLLEREFRLIEYFVYFLLLARKITHVSQRDKIEICVETGEELKDNYLRKIKEYNFPKF